MSGEWVEGFFVGMIVATAMHIYRMRGEFDGFKQTLQRASAAMELQRLEIERLRALQDFWNHN